LRDLGGGGGHNGRVAESSLSKLAG
jgi:hypothetical protein